MAGGFALPAKRRPSWLAVAEGLAAFGCTDTAAGRRRYVERLDAIARAQPRRDCGVPPASADRRMSSLERGWYWGSQAFAEKLLGLLELAGKNRRPANRTYRSSPAHQAHGLRQAEAMLERGLRQARLTRAELVRLPGSDARKVALAQELWQSTTVSQAWLAEHLCMKSAANVSQILRRASRTHPGPVKIC